MSFFGTQQAMEAPCRRTGVRFDGFWQNGLCRSLSASIAIASLARQTPWLLLIAFVACGCGETPNVSDVSSGSTDTGPTDSHTDDGSPSDTGWDALDHRDEDEDALEDLDDVGIDVQLAGLGIDYAAGPAGIEPRYATTDVDWLAVGWPNDRLVRAGGGPDLSNFPNPEARELLQAYLDHGQQVLGGWGLNGAVYFQFQGQISLDSLPDTTTTLQDAQAAVQLVNVSAGSQRYGERMPLTFRWYEGGEDPYWGKQTLALRPVTGFPLAEGATYCALVTRAVRDTEGRHLSVPSEFEIALSEDSSLVPLKSWLSDGQTGLAERDISVATCFTGQNATSELRRVHAFVQQQSLPIVTDIEYLGSVDLRHEFQGHYVAPNFQAGDKPYVTGGDLRFDTAGDPVIQEQEPIRFFLMTPAPQFHPMPPEGYTVVTYSHGTGGDYMSCRDSVGPVLVNQGMAVVCIEHPLHGERGPGGSPLSKLEVSLYSFNVTNPAAGRMSFRQSAIDMMSLTRMIAGGSFNLDATETIGTPYETGLTFAPDPLFFGHSHGGLTGALLLGVDPSLSHAVLSGAGGVLLETILWRKDPDVAALAKLALGVEDDDFDIFHPALSVVQMLVDATDPINYAPYWLRPAPGGTPKNVFVTEGTADLATPGIATEAMAAAAGIPLAQPAQSSTPHTLRAIADVALPVAHNLDSDDGKYTAVLVQWADGAHWVALSDPTAERYWSTFFRTIREGLPARVGACACPSGETCNADGECVPIAGDTCGSDVPVLLLGTPVVGSVTNAKDDFLSNECFPLANGVGVGNDVVFSFTAPSAGSYQFSIESFELDTVLYAFSDCSNPMASCLGGTDQGQDKETLELTLDAGQHLLLVVDDYAETSVGDNGDFRLVAECSSACAEGSTRCVDNVVQSCVTDASTGCPDWFVATDCSATLTPYCDGYAGTAGCVAVQPARPGAQCGDPTLVPLELGTYLGGGVSGTTCGGGNTYDSTCLGDYDGGEDVIYEVVVADETAVAISGVGSEWMGLGLDNGCPFDAMSDACMAQEGSETGVPHLGCQVLTPGTYYLMVDTWPEPDCTEFDLFFTPCVP